MAIGRIGGVSGGDTILETYRFNASGGETSLSGADASGKTLVYPANYEAVFLNGVRLARGLDYTATTGNSITGLAALASGDVVEIAVLQSLDVVQVDYADVRFAAEAPSNPVNGTVWIDSDATVNVADYALTNNPTFTGVVSVADGSVAVPSITNTGDTDTGVYFPADNQVAITTGGVERLVISPTGLDIKRTGANNNLVATTGEAAVQNRIDAASNTNGPELNLIRARGTQASKSIVQVSDGLGAINWYAYDGTANRIAAQVSAFIGATPGASDVPTSLSFATTADGASSLTERLRIDFEGRVRVYGGVLEAPIVTNTQTTSYTLVLADAGKLIEINNAGATTLTIPADASVNFPVGTKIDVLQTGAGQVTIAGSGFTPNATPGLKISAQWGAATLVKRGTNSWVVIGNLSA